MQVAGFGFGDDKRRLAFRENSSLVQNDEVIARFDLVEKVRGPQHADALLNDELPHMAENLGSRLDVQSNRCLVEQEKTRPVHKCPGDFQSPHLPAGKIAHLAAGTVGKPHP